MTFTVLSSSVRFGEIAEKASVPIGIDEIVPSVNKLSYSGGWHTLAAGGGPQQHFFYLHRPLHGSRRIVLYAQSYGTMLAAGHAGISLATATGDIMLSRRLFAGPTSLQVQLHECGYAGCT
jgi:hypothetical protein